ncbi:SKI family transcriptional corepressor 2-like [Pomacea canaliculata]|uniref:SKI family transcriptional corepressor 2-like n=1 Tax=Pomacea canaliculata TaxID=400727 RepID=UPI000D72DEE3|nr:SKI family transcriptional corepressor 2-like [Pomacea canaliculata]
MSADLNTRPDPNREMSPQPGPPPPLPPRCHKLSEHPPPPRTTQTITRTGISSKTGDKGKKKTKKFERQKQQSSFYHNIDCKTDSPDEQPKAGDEDQEAKDDQDESGNDEYEEIDETLLGDPRLGPEGGVDQESRTRDKKAGREASDDKPTMWVLPQQTVPESSRKSEERLLQAQRPDVKGHSSPNKPPEYGTTSGTKTAENISNMSVKELCACLKKCGMGRLAEVCEKNILDGSFLDSTPDKTLTNEPFCLSSFDLLKLKQIKEGWRPNVGR